MRIVAVLISNKSTLAARPPLEMGGRGAFHGAVSSRGVGPPPARPAIHGVIGIFETRCLFRCGIATIHENGTTPSSGQALVRLHSMLGKGLHVRANKIEQCGRLPARVTRSHRRALAAQPAQHQLPPSPFSPFYGPRRISVHRRGINCGDSQESLRASLATCASKHTTKSDVDSLSFIRRL